MSGRGVLLTVIGAVVTFELCLSIALPAICCRVLVVAGGSMRPALEQGDAIVVAPSAGEVPSVGQVVVYQAQSASAPTTHRVIEVRHDAGEVLLETRGDSNEQTDASSLRLADVDGTVIMGIPKAGFLLQWLAQPLSRALIVVVLLAIITAPGQPRTRQQRPALAEW